MNFNKKVVLINGRSGTGKTFSLKNLIQNHGDKVAYLDLDGKHALPFRGKNKIAKYIVPEDPLHLVPGVMSLEKNEEIEYIVIDTMSHWLRLLEQQYVIRSDDSRGAWGKIYQAQLFDLIDFATHKSKKTWIFLSHVQEGDIENGKIPVKSFVKGSTKSIGIESFFNFVIYTDVTDCDDCPEGVSYRFQVKKTKETTHLSVKTPYDMFDSPYVEPNDIMLILDAIDRYDEEE